MSTSINAVKIALATAFPPDPRQPRGGVEAVSVVLAEALARDGDLDVHVVTAAVDQAVAEVVTHGSLTIHRLPWTPRRMLTGAVGRDGRRVRDYVAALRCDVVHAHDTYGVMLRTLPAPRVLTIHGFIHEDTRVSGERWARIRGRIWRQVETAAWAAYPHIISISPYVRERLRGIASGMIHDIENPIAEAFFGVARADTGRDIVSTATISPRKNTLRLVDAFARLRAQGFDATLRLAGAPVGEYADQVRQRIAGLGLERHVDLLSEVPVDGVRHLLANASVMTLVSLEENAPLSIEEAMAVGVPVVTSNRCGMPYMVSHGETGFLVDPNDTAEIAGRLAELLGDHGLRLRMGARGREIARDRFHPTEVARRTKGVYARALGAGELATTEPERIRAR